ncbi:iron-containing alcohol dehydrogenase family protein [Streptococcus dentiloxodontae]
MAKRIIRMSPAEYINEKGILKTLPDLLVQRGIQNPVILTDETVYEVIKPYLPDGFLEENPLVFFGGACTFGEIERLTEVFQGYDALLAFGGGQLIDTAKVVADRLAIKTVNSQTVPSNCAAITTKSIIYSDEHEKIDNVRHKKAVDLVLLEPEILLNAPYEYVLSGIGDTLAKFYEIRRRLTDDKAGLVSVQIGQSYIDICRREMLKVTDIFSLSEEEIINLFDTIFLVAASVDGIADNDGRSVLAHAFYNAYVKVKPDYIKTHGEVVALGSLIQIIAEGDGSQKLRQEIESYHAQIGLPLTLKELGLNKEQEIDALAEYIARPSDVRVRSVFPDLTAEYIRSVLEEVRG